MRSDTPDWIETLLDWRGTWLLARIALSSAYILGGVTKLLNFSGAVAEQEHFGLHPGWIWACLSILVELFGPLLIITGRWVWLGAGALGVLTAIASLVANNFWDLQGQARFQATNTFFEHIGLIAAFVLVALIAARDQRNPSRLDY